MIRKPTTSWQQFDEGATVRTVRTAAAVAKGSVDVARRGGHVMRGLACYFFAIVWGFVAMMSGLFGELPTLIGVGAMSAFMVWAGNRAFAKARAAAD